jgi:hypothetical protein
MKRCVRVPSQLPTSLHHRLNAYALAASAAGAGMLALGPAEARIVYTPAHVVIGRPFPLDLNHDGIVDFYILHSYSAGVHDLEACQFLGSYTHGPFCSVADTNAIRASRNFESALQYGAKIQRGDHFAKFGSNALAAFCCYSGRSMRYWFGPWANGGKGVKNRYLGLRFKIKGRFHFGWARLTVTTTSNDFAATLTGYAYETIPGKAIVAGQTHGRDEAILGRLAQGASGVVSREKK